MTPGGSQQLRRFRIAYRDSGDLEASAREAGIGMTEARLIVREDAKDPPGPECFVLLGHNQKDKPMSDVIAADQLRLLIERVENLEAEKKALSDDIKDVYGEAKSVGFDVKTIRRIVARRKLETHHATEADMLFATYAAALGMQLAFDV